MAVNKYTYLYTRVDYPNGYVSEPEPLPYWIYVTITTDTQTDTKYLTVHSRIHKNKEVRINPDYSASFTDTEILKDLSAEIYRRFID